MTTMDKQRLLEIIELFYEKGSKAYEIMTIHGGLVAEKSVSLAENIPGADKEFIYEAAMLHDIGMIKTNAPDLGCFGDHPYICHGILGEEMLNKLGLEKHAHVCSRHTGTGLSKEEIEEKKLPLPKRDFMPTTLEEEIICYADKFFSKDPLKFREEKPYVQVLKEISKFGKSHEEKFRKWHERFEG